MLLLVSQFVCTKSSAMFTVLPPVRALIFNHHSNWYLFYFQLQSVVDHKYTPGCRPHIEQKLHDILHTCTYGTMLVYLLNTSKNILVYLHSSKWCSMALGWLIQMSLAFFLLYSSLLNCNHRLGSYRLLTLKGLDDRVFSQYRQYLFHAFPTVYFCVCLFSVLGLRLIYTYMVGIWALFIICMKRIS